MFVDFQFTWMSVWTGKYGHSTNESLGYYLFPYYIYTPLYPRVSRLFASMLSTAFAVAALRLCGSLFWANSFLLLCYEMLRITHPYYLWLSFKNSSRFRFQYCLLVMLVPEKKERLRSSWACCDDPHLGFACCWIPVRTYSWLSELASVGRNLCN